MKILRADVKDIVFPGNLQDIMNRVLAAERLSEAQLVEARTKAEKEALEAQTRAETDRVAATAKAETDRIGAVARAEVVRLAAEAEAEAERIRAEAEVEALRAAQRERGRLRPAPGTAAAAGARVARGPVPQRAGPDLHRLRQARQRVDRLTKIQLSGENGHAASRAIVGS